MKYSYEGEGPNLGIKTLFIQYPQDDLDIITIGPTVYNAYINTNIYDEHLGKWVERWISTSKNHKVTIESPFMISDDFEGFSDAIFFYDVLEYKKISYLFLKKQDFIKIRVLEKETLQPLIVVANQYAREGYNVLLMPEYSYDNIGKILIDNYDKIHPAIRFMPPVQDIIKIP
jgi:hypothetical protein